MPFFRMTYPYSRHWPELGLECETDEVIERDENPDPNHFEECDGPAVKPSVEAAKAAAAEEAAKAEAAAKQKTNTKNTDKSGDNQEDGK